MTIDKSNILQFCIRYKVQLLFIIVFCVQIFLRSYLLFQRANLGWDQIDSAWAAKSILIDKHFFINGPVAKGNSGIYMGPLYFYLVTIFYFFTKLDPIASPILQSLLSIGNFVILYYVTKQLFGTNVAFVASIINMFSITVMVADRVQSAYYLIVPISYLIFYALYKIITGNIQFIPVLAIFTGLSFHIDFTSIFYPILIFLTLPFFPKNKKTIWYSLLSIPLFVLFFVPSLIVEFSSKQTTTASGIYLFHTSFHGFHLRRMLQIAHDAFISIEQILEFRIFHSFVFFIFPFFGIVYSLTHPKKQSLLLLYVMSIWIFVPWVILSTYAGELTDYYFSLPRDFVIAIIAYIFVFLLQRKEIVLKCIPLIFLAIYIAYGVQFFRTTPNGNLLVSEENVKQAIQNKQVIPYINHNAASYIYYVYTRNKNRTK